MMYAAVILDYAKKMIAFTLIAIATCRTYAQAARQLEPFSFEVLKSTILNHQLTKIEDLVPLLPAEYRRNFTLMESSRSTQGASPNFPRVIMFGQTGKTLLAFNGDPEAEGFRTLEVTEFNELTKKFEFREIEFGGAGTAPKFSEINPARCAGCHFASEHNGKPELRPNWEDYATWPGAFGRNDDVLHNEDATKLRQFLTGNKNLPIYSALIIAEGSRNAPYSERSKGNIQLRPNARLTLLTSRLNAKRIVGRMESSSHFEVYRDVFLADLQPGDHSFEATIDSLKLSHIFSDVELDRVVTNEKSLTQLVSERLGMRPSDWSLSFGVKDYGGRGKTTFDSTYFDGKWSTKDLVVNELWKKLSLEHPNLTQGYSQPPMLIERTGVDTPEYREIHALGGGAYAPEETRQLAKERLLHSLSALGDRHCCEDVFRSY